MLNKNMMALNKVFIDINLCCCLLFSKNRAIFHFPPLLQYNKFFKKTYRRSYGESNLEQNICFFNIKDEKKRK